MKKHGLRYLRNLRKVARALRPGGYLYASFKYGDFEGERNGRYFMDLTEERLAALVEPVGGAGGGGDLYNRGCARWP